MPRTLQTLVTCEHGGNGVPLQFRELFAGRERILASHRAYDAGALELARRLAAACRAPLLAAETTRLLVDLNRSPRHPQLHAPWVRKLAAEERRAIVAEHHEPHRSAVEKRVAEMLAVGSVAHLSVHSFTPIRRGVVRNADFSLLYDPRRPAERAFAAAWLTELRRIRPELRLRRNYPYLGTADGLTTWLRRRFHDPTRPNEAVYLGIELEVNQKWVRRGGQAWEGLQRSIVESLTVVLAESV